MTYVRYIVLCFLLMVWPAHAEETPRWYAGFLYVNADPDDITDNIGTLSNDGDGEKLFIGYTIDDFLSVEAAYARIDYSIDYDFNPAMGSESLYGSGDVDQFEFSVLLHGHTRHVSPFVKLGSLHYEGDVELAGVEIDYDDTDIFIAVGLDWGFGDTSLNPPVFFRVEYQALDDEEVILLGPVIRF